MRIPLCILSWGMQTPTPRGVPQHLEIVQLKVRQHSTSSCKTSAFAIHCVSAETSQLCIGSNARLSSSRLGTVLESRMGQSNRIQHADMTQLPMSEEDIGIFTWC